MEENQYRLEELAELSGISPRTVRYYTAERLLPAPDARGRVVLYSEAHLQRLALIARLKDAYFPLDAIRSQLEAVTDEQVRTLLAQPGPPSFSDPPTAALPDPAENAVSYITRVLARQAAGKTKSQSAAPPVAAPAERAAETWHRITLAPGVELHARAVDKFVSQIIAYAKTLYKQQ